MMYVQVRLSRTDGRSWDTVISGMGTRKLAEARKVARQLSESAATDYIDVTIEDRNGAITTGSRQFRWSRHRGWQPEDITEYNLRVHGCECGRTTCDH